MNQLLEIEYTIPHEELIGIFSTKDAMKQEERQMAIAMSYYASMSCLTKLMPEKVTTQQEIDEKVFFESTVQIKSLQGLTHNLQAIDVDWNLLYKFLFENFPEETPQMIQAMNKISSMMEDPSQHEEMYEELDSLNEISKKLIPQMNNVLKHPVHLTEISFLQQLAEDENSYGLKIAKYTYLGAMAFTYYLGDDKAINAMAEEGKEALLGAAYGYYSTALNLYAELIKLSQSSEL